jgi:hypothetical protein
MTESNADVKTSKQTCHICSEKAKMMNCTVCQLPTCNIHSMVTGIQSTTRICDGCYREESLKSFFSESLKREKLAQEITLLAEQRDSNTQLLNKSSGKIRQLEKEIQDRESFYKAKIDELKQKIEETRTKAKKEAEELPVMQKETLNNEMQVEIKSQKLEEILNEYRNVKAEADILIKERTALVGELNELSDFIRSYVPVKILRKAICNPCYQQVRHAFVQMFKPVVPIKDEVQGKVSAKAQQNRKGMCTSCGIF